MKISTYGTKYSRMDQVKFFKGCLPQILLGPFLNILSHIKLLFTSLRFSLLVNRKPPIGISQETANITTFSATLIYKKTITFKKFYFCGDAPLNCFLKLLSQLLLLFFSSFSFYVMIIQMQPHLRKFFLLTISQILLRDI